MRKTTLFGLIAAILTLLAGGGRALAQATDKAEPPDGPPTEPILAPEPPIVTPAGTSPTGPAKAVPEKGDGGVSRIAPAATNPAALPQNDKPGSEFFIAAADALKRAQSISYRAKAYATGGMFEPHSAKIQADVRMLRSATAGAQTAGWLIRSTGSGKPKSTSDQMDFDVAWTGNTIEFVSHADKKVIEKRMPREAKSQAFQIATSSRNDELSAARPFSKELVPSVEYEVGARETLDGVECDIVTVNYGEKKAKVRYAFATTDHLPRKIERIIEGSMASGTMVLELSAVEIDDSNPPKLKPELLKVEIPEGYTEERIPKPVAPPPMPKAPPPAEDAKAVPETKVIEKQPAVDPAATSVEQSPAEPPKDAPPSPAPPAPAAPPPPAPSVATPFELRASTGEKISLESLRGNVVLVEFGGSWCLPCRKSHDELDAMLGRFSGKPVKVLALSCRDKSADAAIERFRQKSRGFPLLVEADSVAKAWGVRTYPSYYIVGFDGEIVNSDHAYAKETTIATLGDEIERYLASRSPGGDSKPAEPVEGGGSLLVPPTEK